MDKPKEKHVRFFVDMTEDQDNRLKRLAFHLSVKKDVRVTKAKAIDLAVKAMAKKEGV